MMNTLLIIPAYNEEESLESTVNAIIASGVKTDFIIVNDGSHDKTGMICRKKQYPFLDLPTNLGLAGAFQAGMKYAYRHNYDCAIQFDADGQHLPEYITSLESAICSNDIVIGSRFVDRPKPHSLRMLGSAIISAAIRLTTGKVIRDPTSGFRAFNKRMIKIMALGLNYGPEPDTVSFLIKRADAKVKEVPVEMADRAAGESYFSFGSSMSYMLRMSVSILFIQFIRRRLEGDAK